MKRRARGRRFGKPASWPLFDTGCKPPLHRYTIADGLHALGSSRTTHIPSRRARHAPTRVAAHLSPSRVLRPPAPSRTQSSCKSIADNFQPKIPLRRKTAA
ncbi:hypothetical protein DM56_4802 [Burkholderia mallei]|nr:hypothetical protein DM75_4216 [Burkholderia mallei]KOS91490.1 hypothetical protein DM53_4495 [Burkholderia mallei]KOS95158.1 hypothetical protein DM45_4048 [Burkholderia mallei]KOS99210.1 hypothetical protein DM49_4167 [Burkholderia mallei]KOT02676.1 hypothetical protein DM50_4122 [Burkholderia mallei]